MARAKRSHDAAMTPERVAALLWEWHALAVKPSSAVVAAADFARVNLQAGAAADAQHSFWDNPADLRTLLEGGE